MWSMRSYMHKHVYQVTFWNILNILNKNFMKYTLAVICICFVYKFNFFNMNSNELTLFISAQSGEDHREVRITFV